MERDLSSAKNILNRAKALINGDDSADYLSASVGGLDWKPLVINRKSAGVRMMSRAAFQAEWMEAEPEESKRTRKHVKLKKLLDSLTSGAVVLEAEARPVLPPILRKGVKAVREKRQRMLANRDNSRRRLEFKALVHGADSEKFTAMRKNDRDMRARTIRDRGDRGSRRKFWPLLRAAPLDARKRYDGLELLSSADADVEDEADDDADGDADGEDDAEADVDTGADADTGAVVDGSAVDTDDYAEAANAASRDTDDDADDAASRPPSHGTVPQTALVSPALPTLSTGGAAARS